VREIGSSRRLLPKKVSTRSWSEQLINLSRWIQIHRTKQEVRWEGCSVSLWGSQSRRQVTSHLSTHLSLLKEVWMTSQMTWFAKREMDPPSHWFYMQVILITVLSHPNATSWSPKIFLQGQLKGVLICQGNSTKTACILLNNLEPTTPQISCNLVQVFIPSLKYMKAGSKIKDR
jgi:hypothetical protein